MDMNVLKQPIKLQWGHTFSGMGRSILKTRKNPVPLLQWGHTFSGMGRARVRADMDYIGMLQWGHTFSGMGRPNT